MKPRLPAILMLGVLAVTLAGCHKKDEPDANTDAPNRKSVEAALDKLGLEKAPTLGPVFRDFTLAVFDKNYNAAWNMTTQASQIQIARNLVDELATLRQEIDRLEGELNKPGLSEEDTDFHTAQRDLQRSRLRGLAQLEGDGSKYFAMAVKDFAAVRGFNEIASGKLKVKITGETIAASQGHITEQYEDTNQKGKIPFAFEDGKWKIDFAKLLEKETPAEPAP